MKTSALFSAILLVVLPSAMWLTISLVVTLGISPAESHALADEARGRTIR